MLTLLLGISLCDYRELLPKEIEQIDMILNM